jgi:hypothetical protein
MSYAPLVGPPVCLIIICLQLMRIHRLLCVAAMFPVSAPLLAHGVGTTGPAQLDWHTAQIPRVVSASYSWNNLGVTALGAAGEVVTIDGRRCRHGTQFDLDVGNEYAREVGDGPRMAADWERQIAALDVRIDAARLRLRELARQAGEE